MALLQYAQLREVPQAPSENAAFELAARDYPLTWERALLELEITYATLSATVILRRRASASGLGSGGDRVLVHGLGLAALVSSGVACLAMALAS